MGNHLFQPLSSPPAIAAQLSMRDVLGRILQVIQRSLPLCNRRVGVQLKLPTRLEAPAIKRRTPTATLAHLDDAATAQRSRRWPS